VEFVSSHFHYQEEYIFGHTIGWLDRKYLQATKERMTQKREDVDSMFRALKMFGASMFGNGKEGDIEKEMPPTFEEVMEKAKREQFKTKEEAGKEVDETMWWKKDKEPSE
jgi:hypothetical protein